MYGHPVSGLACRPACSFRYTLSYAPCCAEAVLTPATCHANKCDGKPAAGTRRSWRSNPALESTCRHTCKRCYTSSGVSSCMAGVRTPAIGQASTLVSGLACRTTCAIVYLRSGAAWCMEGGLTQSICHANPCSASQPLANGDVLNVRTSRPSRRAGTLANLGLLELAPLGA